MCASSGRAEVLSGVAGRVAVGEVGEFLDLTGAGGSDLALRKKDACIVVAMDADVRVGPRDLFLRDLGFPLPCVEYHHGREAPEAAMVK